MPASGPMVKPAAAPARRGSPPLFSSPFGRLASKAASSPGAGGALVGGAPVLIGHAVDLPRAPRPSRPRARAPRPPRDTSWRGSCGRSRREVHQLDVLAHRRHARRDASRRRCGRRPPRVRCACCRRCSLTAGAPQRSGKGSTGPVSEPCSDRRHAARRRGPCRSSASPSSPDPCGDAGRRRRSGPGGSRSAHGLVLPRLVACR